MFESIAFEWDEVKAKKNLDKTRYRFSAGEESLSRSE